MSNADAASFNTLVNSALPQPWQGLRDDLKLHKGASDEWGQPTWVLEEPLSGQLFRLRRDEHDLLLCLITRRELSSAFTLYGQRNGQLPSVSEVTAFLTMLQQENLHRVPQPLNNETTAMTFAQRLRSMLFIKVPLIRPQALLTALLPVARFCSWRALPWLLFIAGMIGLLRVIPQWEQFIASGGYLFTPLGALSFTLCLIVIKILHELAHGLAARIRGLFVPEMGVMLIILWPIFYTDTTQAWKLPSRRDRMAIDSAGIRFELSLAALAIFLWPFTQPGLTQNLLFFIATSALISSLLINLNPLMRFDGYYLLMNLWGTDNLQTRARELAQYKLRRALWDWQGEAPEQHPQPRALATYGVLSFTYRLFIGLSLSLVVYAFLDAQLGAIAFLTIFLLLAVAPICNEAVALMKQSRLMGRTWRVAAGMAVICGLLALLFLPLQQRNNLDGMVVYGDEITLKAPAAGRLNSTLPAVGSQVSKGQLIAQLHNDELTWQQQDITSQIAINEARIKALRSNGEQGALRNYLQANNKQLQATASRLNQQVNDGAVYAPRTAIVVSRHEKLTAGNSVAAGLPLITLAAPHKREIIALLPKHEAVVMSDALLADAEVRFGDGITENTTAVLHHRHNDGDQPYLPRDSLYDLHGGPIATTEDAGGSLIPRGAFTWLVYSLPGTAPTLAHGTPVKLRVKGARRSLWTQGKRALQRRLHKDGVL